MKKQHPIASTYFPKFHLYILIILLVSVPSILMANNYLSVSSVKQGKFYNNNAVIFDLQTNEKIKSIDLGKSYKVAGNFLELKDTDKKYYYLPTSKKRAELKVFKSETMELLYSYPLDPIDKFVLQLEFKQFIKLNSDLSKLYIQTSQKKLRQILVINNTTGQLLKKLQLKKGKTVTKLSLNEKYLISRNIPRNTVSIYDAKNLELMTEFYLNKAKSIGPNFQNYLFSYVSYEYRNKTAYKIQALNINTLKKLNFEISSKSVPVFAYNEVKGKLYLATNELKSNYLKVYEFSDGDFSHIAMNDLRIKPQSIVFHENTDDIMIVGMKSIIKVDVGNPENSLIMEKPFDTKNTIWSPENNRLYLREGSGSEVAALDTNNGKLLNRSGTGRPGVKFGQFLASAAFSVVAYNFGYIGYAYNLSSTLMILDEKNDFLYVINAKTNDVTRFKASDLSGREAIATGKGTTWMYQDHAENSKIFVVSNKKVNFLNNQKLAIDKEINYKKFLGLDFDRKITFLDTGDSIEACSMLDGTQIKKLSLENSNYIIAL